MILAILLYEQILDHTQINLCQNMLPLSTQQRAYQSFQVTSGFDSFFIHVARVVNFIKMG